MALITCPECRNEISDIANICVHCGFPISKVEPIILTPSINEEFEVQAEVKRGTTEQQCAEKDIEVNKDKSNISFWSFNAAKILLALIILALCLSVFSVYNSTKIAGMENRINNLEADINYADQRIRLTSLGVQMSEGIVTDKAVVQKALFFISDIGTISAVVDLRPQPSYTTKFLGQGDFDLTDRELRSMIKEIVDEILDYGSFDFALLETEYNLSIDTGTIYITANNYNVAEYKDGEITLAGE
jgi:cell division protein FtsL